MVTLIILRTTKVRTSLVLLNKKNIWEQILCFFNRRINSGQVSTGN